jgi:hypothetical protein
VGEWLVGVLHPAVSHVAEIQTGSMPTNVNNNFIERWRDKRIGFAAAFAFGHRAALAIREGWRAWRGESCDCAVCPTPVQAEKAPA